jgi:GntR family transcriptional regulator of arabinose operon
LRGFIEEQRLNGLHRLPSERHLANSLNCSRMTVSKAMAHLAGEGLVERRQGSGTYIIENSRENRTYNIGIGMRSSYHAGEQHFVKVMREISKSAGPLNLHLQIFDNLMEQFERNPVSNGLLKTIDSDVLDGVLLISRMPVKIIGALKGKVPLAIVNNNAFGYVDVPSVCCDYFQAGFLAAEYLIHNGHRTLGYVCTESREHPEVLMHLSGMRCACRAYGAPELSEQNVLVFSAEVPKRKHEIASFLHRTKATALFTRNDMIAAYAMRGMEEAGIRVPEDISVLGQGNFSWGGQPDVPLTTIDTKLDVACKLGLEMIRKLAHGDEDVPTVTTVTPELIERKTVRRVDNRALGVQENN